MSETRETILEGILRHSKADAESAIATAKRVAEREVSTAKRRARSRERQVREDLDERTTSAKAQSEARAGGDAQRMKLKRRHELAEGLSGEALGRLAERPRDDGYIGVVERLLAAAARELGAVEAVVTVNAVDREYLAREGRFAGLAARVEEATGVKVELGDETIEASGGVVLSTKGGQISYRNTFEEIAYREADRLRLMISQELTG